MDVPDHRTPRMPPRGSGDPSRAGTRVAAPSSLSLPFRRLLVPPNGVLVLLRCVSRRRKPTSVIPLRVGRHEVNPWFARHGERVPQCRLGVSLVGNEP